MAHEKIVTAFNQIQQAEAAKEKLIVEGIAEKNIDIISGERLRVEDKELRHPSFWQRLFGDDLDDDYASEYSKAIRSGGVLLTVRAPKDQADHIEQELSQFAADYSSLSSRDTGAFASREFAGETNDRSINAPGVAPDSLTSVSQSAITPPDATTGSISTTATGGKFAADRDLERDSLTTDRDALKLAEEQVDISKRQVNDGSVRLRRYTVEDEVTEDVSLFDQHAEVFRNAVDEPAYLNDVDWSDKTIEVEESHEVPVISKTARIKEEVGLRGEETSRVETVKDSVRRQEVDIDHTKDSTRLESDTRLEKDKFNKKF
ncbi:YsnF/AvaK domain-containing protein [Erwinia sp. 9145]|uniref:YsnF/AvaK domain-containing protein n=1 Tax=Erwinia sp. 9145 TaxID=1500895 RepID=UPI00068E586B|nr:YsnF/AvaK domain-containing protein [Erwinia sp. 9145]